MIRENMREKMDKQQNGLSAAALHMLAMALMLCDHMWAAIFPAAEWLTCIGRVAFPIFAFLIAEGYFHTHDLRRYLLRLLAWAVVSEIPFNLMYAGSVLYPFHQNVLWTFFIALLIIAALERAKARFRPVPRAAVSVLLIFLGYAAGYAAMADYYGTGVLMVLAFYFFHGKKLSCFIGQFLCLYYLNVVLLGGYYYVWTVPLLGYEAEIVQQGFALLALVPIWLYRGRQGPHGKAFRYFCYAFYPVHMLALCAARAWILAR